MCNSILLQIKRFPDSKDTLYNIVLVCTIIPLHERSAVAIHSRVRTE